MIQAPNLVNPYMYPQQTVQQPNYNAVKIDIHNPSVGTPGSPQAAPQAPQHNSQYATPTMPYYSYPQAQLYDYQQAAAQTPYYMPPQMTYPMPAQAPVAPQAQAAPVQAVPPVAVNQQNINVPQPVVTETPQAAASTAPAQAPAVEVVPPAPLTPQVDLNAFLAKLSSPDYEIQANAMEEIANMVKDEPQKATELLDEKVITSLTNIIKADSSKLTGPTQEQIAARQKLMSGTELPEADKKLATTITPMEQAERNKSYAMFTASIMQKLYGEEVAKLTGANVPLTELPGAVTVVEQLKDNANPMVRTSAIEALSYIQQPAYKEDLKTLFTIAQNDADKNVQDAATAALEKLNKA